MPVLPTRVTPFLRACAAVLALVCAAPAAAKGSKDTDAPEITLDPVLKAETGSSITIDAGISDPSGLFEPRLYFRPIGQKAYRGVDLIQIPGTDRYRAEIPGTAVTGPLEYYVEAFDLEGNGPARSAQPARPHRLFVASKEPVPGFELPGAPPPDSGPMLAPLPPATSPTAPPAPSSPGFDALPATAGPEILHQPPVRPIEGRSVPIEASFRGKAGVFYPVVFFRRAGSSSFTSLGMAELPASVAQPATLPGVIYGPGGTGRFVAEVPAAFSVGQVEYYIEALDTLGNGPSRMGTKDAPLAVATVRPDEQLRIDPVVALANCREIPRDSEAVDLARLGPCRQVPQDVPLDAISRYGFGELKLRYENFTDALSAFDDVVNLAPLWPAAWFRLAQAAEGAREWKRSRAAYRRYIELTGRPPEFDALLQRLASVEYSIEEAARDEAEAKKKADEDAAREAARKAELAAREEKRQSAINRERLFSGPGQFGFVVASVDTFAGTETQYALQLRARLKADQFQFLYLAASLSLGYSNGTHLAVLPAVGVNFLALPAPSDAHFTLLSPFLAYQPRFQLLGDLSTHTGIVHAMVIGNHFEFGDTAVEVGLAFGIAGAQQVGLEFAIGPRLDKP